MDKPIQVGDLVVAVRPKACCGRHSKKEGVPYVVTSLVHQLWSCRYCGKAMLGVVAFGDWERGFEVSRLKRIPPLSELGDVRQDEEITV